MQDFYIAAKNKAKVRKKRPETWFKSKSLFVFIILTLHKRAQKLTYKYLNGEYLNSHKLVEQLSLPHTPEAPPGFNLDQLQRLVPQNGGRGWGPGILQRDKKKKTEEDSVILYSLQGIKIALAYTEGDRAFGSATTCLRSLGQQNHYHLHILNLIF